MATVNIVLTTSNTMSTFGDTLSSVPKSVPKYTVDITSSASSQATAATNAQKWQDIWVITVDGGNVRAKFGTSPTAVTASDWLLRPGTYYFGVSVDGEQVAIIN